MKHTIHKMFWAWEHEKEEKWLNEMSAKGLQLISPGPFTYIFEEGPCGEYHYRLELLNHVPSHPESIAYIRFLEETGIEQIGSYLRWVYFRKKVADGEFDLYSDLSSKIKHYKLISNLLLAVTPINIFPMIINFSAFIHHRNSVNLFSVLISLTISLLLGLGLFKINKKTKHLKKQQLIQE